MVPGSADRQAKCSLSKERLTSWHKEQSVSPPCQSPAFTHSANWPHHQNTKNPVVKTPKTEGLLPRSQKTQVPAQAPVVVTSPSSRICKPLKTEHEARTTQQLLKVHRSRETGTFHLLWCLPANSSKRNIQFLPSTPETYTHF